MIKRRLTPRPKALWLTAFPPPTAYSMVKDSAARSGRPLPPLPLRAYGKPRKPLRAVSAQRRPLLAEYAKLRRAFLKTHPVCLACDAIHRAEPAHRAKPSTDVHHMNGRVGRLLCFTDYWLPVCRKCHDWIGAHPKEARNLGLLCKAGDWNRQPIAIEHQATAQTPAC